MATDYTQDANCEFAYLMKTDTGAGDMVDASSNGRDGTLKGDGEPNYESSAPTGYDAGSYHSDGLPSGDDYVDINYAPVVTDFSIVCWYVVDDTVSSEEEIIGGIESGGNSILQLGINGSSKLVANVRDETPNLDSIVDTDTTPTGSWQHAAVTFDKSDGSSGFKLYRNASSVATPVGVTATGTINLNASPLHCFCRSQNNTPENFFDGSITELAYFSRVLSSSEINDIMNHGLDGTMNAPTPSAQALSLTLNSPSISITGDASVSPSALALSLTLPSVTLSISSAESVTVQSLSLTLQSPNLNIAGSPTVSPSAQSLSLTLSGVTISTGQANATVTPDAIALVLTLSGILIQNKERVHARKNNRIINIARINEPRFGVKINEPATVSKSNSTPFSTSTRIR